jgi:hypothetical protein
MLRLCWVRLQQSYGQLDTPSGREGARHGADRNQSKEGMPASHKHYRPRTQTAPCLRTGPSAGVIQEKWGLHLGFSALVFAPSRPDGAHSRSPSNDAMRPYDAASVVAVFAWHDGEFICAGSVK